MDDLFRFWLIRPASPVASKDVNPLTASFTHPEMTRDAALRAARAFVDSGALTRSAESLKYADIALQVASKSRGKPVAAAEVSAIVKNATGDTVEKLVANSEFIADEKQLADTLVAMKLLSDSTGGDAPGLALVARGYDAIRLAASGRDPIALRVLSVADFARGGKGDPAPPAGQQPAPPSGPTSPSPSTVLADIENAITHLGTVPAAGFQGGTPDSDTPGSLSRVDTRLAGESGVSTSAGSLPVRANRPWVMSQTAISALPAKVIDTISGQASTSPLSLFRSFSACLRRSASSS